MELQPPILFESPNSTATDSSASSAGSPSPTAVTPKPAIASPSPIGSNLWPDAFERPVGTPLRRGVPRILSSPLRSSWLRDFAGVRNDDTQQPQPLPPAREAPQGAATSCLVRDRAHGPRAGPPVTPVRGPLASPLARWLQNRTPAPGSKAHTPGSKTSSRHVRSRAPREEPRVSIVSEMLKAKSTGYVTRSGAGISYSPMVRRWQEHTHVTRSMPNTICA